MQKCFSFNKLLLQKEELEQKHLHLLQIVESEKTAKWQYTQQCEELASEIKKLRAEVRFSICSIKILLKKNYSIFCLVICIETGMETDTIMSVIV